MPKLGGSTLHVILPYICESSIGSPEKVGHPSEDLGPVDYNNCQPGGPCENGLIGSDDMVCKRLPKRKCT